MGKGRPYTKSLYGKAWPDTKGPPIRQRLAAPRALPFVLIVLGVCLDLAMGTGRTLFVLRRFTDLIEWAAFWR